MLEEMIRSLEPDLNCIKEHIREALDHESENSELDRLLHESMENTGKMIRPLLLLLVAGDDKEKHRDELMAVGAAIEMLHTSTLILDDMIDSSPLRRGKPTIHKEYGTEVALYVGDYLLVRTYSYLLEKGCCDEAGILMKVGQTACDGEMLQHGNTGDPAVSMEDYLKAINGKTARFFRAICTMACRITKKDEDLTRLYEDIGETLGMMFQIRDDYLDWTCESSLMGKPVNEDFLKGVYTMPAIYTFPVEVYGDELSRIALKEEKSSEDMKKAVDLVASSGGLLYTRAYLSDLGTKAAGLIASLPKNRYTDAIGLLAGYCALEDGKDPGLRQRMNR